MVAYSFKPRFAQQIVGGRKRQTIRASRRRHAREGERVQLYVGMRTRLCRKLIPDPVVMRVVPVELLIGPKTISSIRVDGVRFNAIEKRLFAQADGFANLHEMHAFWVANHGEGRFDGVLICWSAA